MIVGTGNQRNGTVYADAPADDFTVNNLAGGVIDAGAGNAGSGVSLQLGAADGDTRTVTLSNAGTITGRGATLPSGATAGVRLFNGAGAGTTVTVDGTFTNSGTISSETAAAVLIENVGFTDESSLVNSGTLTGPQSFNAVTSQTAIVFNNAGGTLTGDFVGSNVGTDALNFTSGTSTLVGNVMNNVDVTVNAGAALDVNGVSTIDGDFIVNGTVDQMVLGTDRIDVGGALTFGADSVVNVVTPFDVASLPLGQPITVISDNGVFTNNGVEVNVIEDDFLLDYTTQLGSVVVTPVAADVVGQLAGQSSNIVNFGGSLQEAFVAGALPTAVVNTLNNSADAAAFSAQAAPLLPSLNEGITREIFETQSVATRNLAQRLQDEKTIRLLVDLNGRSSRRDNGGDVTINGYNRRQLRFDPRCRNHSRREPDHRHCLQCC